MEEQSEKRADGPERGNDGRQRTQRATLWAAVRHPPGVPLWRNVGGWPIRGHDWLAGEAQPRSGVVSPLDAALEIVSTRDCGARAHCLPPAPIRLQRTSTSDRIQKLDGPSLLRAAAPLGQPAGS